MRLALVIATLWTSPLVAQEFFTLKGHGGPIMDITVSETGQIATASFDNSVGVWSDDKPAWLDAHKAAVNVVVFLNEDTLASAGDDYEVRIWPLGSDSRLIGSHGRKVMDLDFAPNTQVLASASWDGTIGLWPDPLSSAYETSIDPKFLEGHKQGVNNVVFDQSGTRLFSASVDGTIRVWDVEKATETQVLVKHGFGVNTIILNEADGWLAYGGVDGGTRLVDLDTGEPIADFTLNRRPILSMSFDPSSHQLAVGDGEGYIMVIDTDRLQVTRDFRAAQRGPIWALAFSIDGQNVHAGGIEDIMYSWPVATMDAHGKMSDETPSFLEDAETLSNGERQFKRKCSICHTLTDGSARKAGPSLYQLFGRPAGSVTDYNYSDILEGSEIVWSADTIHDLFDLGPDHYIPGTKMPMQRITKKADRDDLIEYLKLETAQRDK